MHWIPEFGRGVFARLGCTSAESACAADFYLALAASYGDTGRRVARILGADADRQAVVEILTETIDSDDEWRSLLAMWGRRLVGDTLLVARAALRPKHLQLQDEQKVEPVFTQLMAAHSRRMDDLGLAA